MPWWMHMAMISGMDASAQGLPVVGPLRRVGAQGLAASWSCLVLALQAREPKATHHALHLTLQVLVELPLSRALSPARYTPRPPPR